MPTSSKTSAVLDQATPIALFLVFVAVFGLLAWFLLWPAYAQFLQGGSLNYETKQAELVKRKEYLSDLQRFKATYEGAKGTSADKLAVMIPKGRDAALLFAMHEALAKQRGLVLNAIDIVAPTGAGKREGLNELNVTLKLGGVRYNSFKQYVKDLESLLRITEIDSMGFDARSGTVNLNLKTYYTGSDN